MKQSWKPGTMIYPLPAVLISCGESEQEYNLFTVAWTTIAIAATMRTTRTTN